MEDKSLSLTTADLKKLEKTVKDMLEDIDVSESASEGSEEAMEKKRILEKEEKNKFVYGEYVSIGDCFLVQKPIYTVLQRNISKGVNTLLLGPTGVGKTELIANIAQEMELPITIFDMGTMTDPIMSLVGTHVITVKDGVTSSQFRKSRFSEVIQQPGIVLLDEISRSSAAANNLLFPCLDFRRSLSMEYCFENPMPISIHPECSFVATANLGSQYTGTHKLDKALIDRFMMIEIDPLQESEIEQIISHIYPSLVIPEVKMITKVYMQICNAHKEFTISFTLSMRHVKLIASMIADGFTIYDAYYVVCKGIGGADGLTGVEEILKKIGKA
jgi:MoxR-like ATPase